MRRRSVPRVPLLVRIDPALKRRIERLAVRRQAFESAIVVEALRVYLDAAERKGDRP